MSEIRVLIADDHAVFREGLASLINAQKDMVVVCDASDGNEAVRLSAEEKPHVAVIDVTMPGLGGIAAIKKIRQVSPDTRALVLTMHDDQTYLRAVLAAGGVGYVVKSSPGKQLLAAIREVYQGRSYINVTIAPDTLKEVVEDREQSKLDSKNPLSEREIEVLRYLVHGFTSKEIAAKLHVSSKTVDTYRVRVSEKLGLKKRSDLVRYALETGLLGDRER